MQYVLTLLEEYSLLDLKSVFTPMNQRHKLNSTDGVLLPDLTHYRSLIGKIALLDNISSGYYLFFKCIKPILTDTMWLTFTCSLPSTQVYQKDSGIEFVLFRIFFHTTSRILRRRLGYVQRHKEIGDMLLCVLMGCTYLVEVK